MAIPQEILEILICPVCMQPVKLTAQNGGLCCERCNLIYPIVDDIPVMRSDKAIRV